MAGIDVNALLVLHCDTDTSTTFTDSSQYARTVTANGGAIQSSLQEKFGPASGLFVAVTSSFLSIPDSADWDFGTGAFTVDFWFRPNTFASGTAYTLFDRNSLDFILRRGTGDSLAMFINGVEFDFGTWTPATDTWYHIAVSRSGSSVRCFIDGTQLGSTGSSSSNIQGTTAFEIGRRTTAAEYIDGFIDEFRISNVARWTANFTPPDQAYSGAAGSFVSKIMLMGI